jgi:hypothetical protein
MLSSGQAPQACFLRPVEIILAQISLKTCGTSLLRPCSVSVLRCEVNRSASLRLARA